MASLISAPWARVRGTNEHDGGVLFECLCYPCFASNVISSWSPGLPISLPEGVPSRNGGRSDLALIERALYRILKTQYGAPLDINEAITAVRSEGMIFKTRKEEEIALLDSWRRRDKTSQAG
ncbi:hypothetical protein UA08_03081 [Talaromyces atroroseus]|uniref:Uncharacterized protein n=1 Tax=Talaromyces atroroseus TaxID=1441469 RepID=A0A225B6C9_TALAT|nr:hypothetical protein UA08_03081 [Talaromyces atroroseus]OKL61457.1 hypothetical protein UA08_03081 [Talaromyces atroroseus]